MMQRAGARAKTATRSVLAVCAAWAVGCGSAEPSAGADAATDVTPDLYDSGAPDDAPDAAPDDVADARAEAAVDAVAHEDPCEADAVVDLATAPRVGNRIVYRGTTAAGPGAQPWALPTTCFVGGRAIRVVAHRYTATARVSVAVTTASAYSAGHDTVLWYGRACQAPPAMTACSDDTTGSAQSRITITGWAPGFSGHFFVATAAAQDGEPGHPYELIVDEYPTPAEGAACTVGNAAVCEAGTTCVRFAEQGYGACRADGTTAGARCRGAEPRCDDGLECVGTTCFSRAGLGATCRPGAVLCGAGQRCVLSDPASGEGTCALEGSAGAGCSATISCAEGLRCSNPAPTGTATGVCQRHAAPGEACTGPGLSAAAVCDAPSECVPATPGSTGHVCRAPGTAAGARCRDDGTCDGALRCNATAGRGYCRAAATEVCAPTLAASDCGAGRVCAPTDLTAGRCVAWAREGVADNDTEAQAEAPRALPFAVRGALSPAGDNDCYRFELAREGDVALRVHDGTGRCLAGASPAVMVYGEHEIQPVLSAPGCNASVGVSGYRLPAGRYVACVRPTGGAAVLDYFFAVGAR